ncbi:DUF4240 domain-containing protein [Cellulosimicrobium cellulans]|uniref:DUF4240 domain-containing protein n=1 Tax=Cellulosimicrobium cellulans TaxID=1710 RepID=UPI0020CC980D|nr:DUF4240 domain-containing protein [Cellulosimicrobium cellulans]
MDRETFWGIVETARERAGAGADDRGAEDDPLPGALTDLLVERLTADEMLAFVDVAGDVANDAYAWPVWGAAYLVEGGCSDDGFMDFRDGLVLAGRAVLERTLADPDSLADHPVVAAMADGGSPWFGFESLDSLADHPVVAAMADGGSPWFGFESLDSLVRDAWSRATGEDDEAYYAARERTSSVRARSEPAGEPWDFDDDEKNARRLPRLTALFAV